MLEHGVSVVKGLSGGVTELNKSGFMQTIINMRWTESQQVYFKTELPQIQRDHCTSKQNTGTPIRIQQM